MSTLGSKPINYGQANGGKVNVEIQLAASVAFKYLGGKFVSLDSSEQAALTVASDTRIFGWADAGEFTSSATAGNDKVSVNVSREAQYWMPASAAVTRDLVGKTCDVNVASGIQQATVTLSTRDVLKIWDVDIPNQLVLVSIIDTAQTGVI